MSPARQRYVRYASPVRLFGMGATLPVPTDPVSAVAESVAAIATATPGILSAFGINKQTNTQAAQAQEQITNEATLTQMQVQQAAATAQGWQQTVVTVAPWAAGAVALWAIFGRHA